MKMRGFIPSILTSALPVIIILGALAVVIGHDLIERGPANRALDEAKISVNIEQEGEKDIACSFDVQKGNNLALKDAHINMYIGFTESNPPDDPKTAISNSSLTPLPWISE